MINFTTVNNITIRRAAALFGDLNKSITWDLIESTMEQTSSASYHNLIEDLLTNDDTRFRTDDDQETILPTSYIFASIEDYISNNETSHLTLDLIRQLYTLITDKLVTLACELQAVEELADKIAQEFGKLNPNQSVQSWIWDSEEDTFQYKAWLKLADLCDSSTHHQQLVDMVKNYIPTFNY